MLETFGEEVAASELPGGGSKAGELSAELNGILSWQRAVPCAEQSSL